MISSIAPRPTGTYKYQFTCNGSSITGVIRASDYGAAHKRLEKIMMQYSEIQWWAHPSQQGHNMCINVALWDTNAKEPIEPLDPESYLLSDCEEEADDGASDIGIVLAVVFIVLIIFCGMVGGDIIYEMFTRK